jgi:hypothetical protein
MRLQNARLFGGDGQPGAIKFILDQHKELAEKLDINKTELLTRIDATKTDLMLTIETKKDATDATIKELAEKHAVLDKKMTRVMTVGATVNAMFIGALGILGIYHRGH